MATVHISSIGENTVTNVVEGPSSSTDGNLVKFDGTTGKLLKDGGAPSAIVFPDADPHVAGAGYWSTGTFTKSSG